MSEYTDFPPNIQAVLAVTEASDSCTGCVELVCAELEAFIQTRRSLGAAGCGISPLDIALEYIDRGWSPVPVPHKSKGPTAKGWQNLRITEADAPQWFNGEAQNIGVLLGEASGGLTDVDLDWPEARAAAPYLLPPTCIFGRASSPGAHRLYVTELAGTETKAAIKFPFAAEGCKPDVLELRIGAGGAAQTIFPPSVHPSGELIAWEDRRPPVRLDGAELKKGLGQTAAAAVLAHLYPQQGGRHDAAVAIGGFLARGGYTAPQAKLFVEAVAVASCQPLDKRRDMIRAAESGVADFAAGKPVAGFPKLGEVFGDKAAKAVADWLGYRGEATVADDRNPAPCGRASFPVPRFNDELTPVMRLLDNQLSTDEPAPPMRTVTGWPVEVQLSEPMGMHELTADGANDEELENSQLPPPKTYTLARHDNYSMALLIENYVRFFKNVERKDGSKIEVAKRLPSGFIESYLAFRKSKLPLVSALMTMPVVLANGELLATNGLDRKRRIFFSIEPEIIELLPDGEVLKGEVEEAMRFLADQWLVDVKTDYNGKCVLIALALTVLERELFGERPAFFVTAGKRGGGKTTVLIMIALALTGRRAAAAAFSPSEEERRKSIFAALLQGVPLIVWDNIKLGTAISCPTIEKVLTSTELEDRVLGESRTERASCSAILAFTGNNITPKGDLASRSLTVRINVDRPDPENREFAHPDPFKWTIDHRGEIIKALYTILLGNPRLRQKPKQRAAAQTRFKPWWHIIGAAIEFAADLCNSPINFREMFAGVEATDEEAATLAETLQSLAEMAPPKSEQGCPAFTSACILKELKKDGGPAPALKSFFSTRDGETPSHRAIIKKLSDVIDTPTWVGEEIWALHRDKISHGNLTEFYIERSGPK